MSAPERRILLNPGPATTSDTVKQALVIPDVCPREREFCDLLADVRRRVAAVAGDPAELVTVPLAGSGTAALEATLLSCVPEDGMLVVVDNGDYGARLATMARTHRLPHRTVSFGWGRPVLLDAVEQALVAPGRPATHLAFVHHETSTGMANAWGPLVALARPRGVRVLADTMSSFGALPVRVGAGALDAAVTSANKCLQGMAGLGLVVMTEALRKESRRIGARTLALDLVAEADHLDDTGQGRFTIPPQLVNALHRALLELEEETREGRHARYSANHTRLRRGVVALGFEPLLDPSEEAGILLAVREPEAEWYDFQTLHDRLYARGFTIYPGKASGTRTFRLSVLGDLYPPDISAFLAALREVMGELGARLP